jgi:outer membrane protein assembly factor BamB
MVTTFKCPECDAALEVASGTSIVRCKFCGASVDVRRTAARASTSEQRARDSRSGGGSAAPFAVGIMVLVLFITGGVIFFVARGGSKGGHAKIGGSSLMWYPAQSSPPWAGLVNDDGIEDVVGLVESKSSGTRLISAAAFDGSTFQPIWQIPLTDPKNARYVHFAVAGQRLIATDAKQTARIYELPTGKELGKVPLPDQADGLCANATQAWVLTVDKTGVLVDLATMHGEPAKQPAWCSLAPLEVYNVFSGFKRRTDAEAHASAGDDLTVTPSQKSIPGFAQDFVLSGDGAVVAVGAKSPGTRLPMMVGLSPKGTALWSRQLSADSSTAQHGVTECGAIGHGVVVGAFPETSAAPGGDLHVVALDAKTGTPRWDAKLVGAGRYIRPDWIVITGTRVYVSIGIALSVFDLRSGATVGTVGGSTW